MTSNKLPELSEFSIHGRLLSPVIFRKPEHVANVLKYFGPQNPSTLGKIVCELDMIAIRYRIAVKSRPLKFEEAKPILAGFEKSLRKAKKLWLGQLRPLHPAIISLALTMIPPNERKQRAPEAMASINVDRVVTVMLQITAKLRDAKSYAAGHYQAGGKSVDRAFLWEPLMRLMEKHDAKPGQYGPLIRAIKFFHLALGIDPPSEGAIKKMGHDLRNAERSKRGKGYAGTKKRPNA
jgi:hypothetical protein